MNTLSIMIGIMFFLIYFPITYHPSTNKFKFIISPIRKTRELVPLYQIYERQNHQAQSMTDANHLDFEVIISKNNDIVYHILVIYNAVIYTALRHKEYL